MDAIDILVTIVILVVIVGGELVKMKKKLASSPQESQVKEEEIDEYDDILERGITEEPVVSENESFNENSSKSPSYFTYEELSKRDETPSTNKVYNPTISEENHLQEVENEIETTEIDLQNPKELKKAIIYGEILKNPYN